ncbi:hypothetical protein QBC47DRAFT_338200 [Echria macrotheca]|uniref:Uncharacterized protein n=1 Tax=Echria macrotheca TaxID=438768 RepID=A0AAJ0FDX2_9PEZI|nr:hypothetical protein QBC47DRAFT_338200 [Echria macrotheca]
MNDKSTEYSPLGSTDEDRSLLDTDSAYGYLRRQRAPRPWLIIANILLFCISILSLAISATLFHEAGGLSLGLFPTKNRLLKATSQPSPILDRITIALLTKRMNGTLLDPNPSIYRLPPSPAVDSAWDRIQTRNPIAISRADILRLNKNPSDAARFPSSWGYGPDDGYIAKIDVFHQIHCLNTLRKHLVFNYPYYFPPSSSSSSSSHQFAELHVSHCVETLLENLMCTANVDLYTHFWMDAQEHAFPDFNIDHKCRDFDAVLAFQEEHSVPVEKFAEVRRPEDYEVHVMSHEFKEVLGWYADGNRDGLEEGEGEIA